VVAVLRKKCGSEQAPLSWHLPEALHNPEMCVYPVHVRATYVVAHFAHFPSLIELFCRQPIRITAHGRAAVEDERDEDDLHFER
jgi:hypothetical protein